MIKEAIQSIIDAENQAENILKEANIKAHKIVADSKKYQGSFQQQTKERLSKEAEEHYKQAEETGGSKADAVFLQCQKDIEKITLSGEKNAQKAKGYIKRRLFEI